jgi:hypothetical protein
VFFELADLLFPPLPFVFVALVAPHAPPRATARGLPTGPMATSDGASSKNNSGMEYSAATTMGATATGRDRGERKRVCCCVRFKTL